MPRDWQSLSSNSSTSVVAVAGGAVDAAAAVGGAAVSVVLLLLLLLSLLLSLLLLLLLLLSLSVMPLLFQSALHQRLLEIGCVHIIWSQASIPSAALLMVVTSH